MKQITETTILIETSKRFSIFTAALFKVTGFVAEKLLPHRLTRNIAIAVLPILISGCFSGISIDKITIENVKAQFWGSAPITDTLPSIQTTPTTLPQLELTLTDYANNLAKTAQPTGTWTPVQSMTSTSTSTLTPTPNNATATFTVIPVTAISTPIPGNEVQATLTAMAGGNPTAESTATVLATSTSTTAATATYTIVPQSTATTAATSTFTPIPTSTTKPTEASTATPIKTATNSSTNTPISTVVSTSIPTGTTTPTGTSNAEGYSLKIFDKNKGNAMTEYHIKLNNLLCGEGTIGGNGIFFVNDQDAFYVAQKAFELKTNFGGTEAPDFVNKLEASNAGAYKIMGYLATQAGERIFLVNAGPDLKLHVLIEEAVTAIPNLGSIAPSNNMEVICVGTNPNGGGQVAFVQAVVRDGFTTVLDSTSK